MRARLISPPVRYLTCTTPKQKRILALHAKGVSTKDIAHECLTIERYVRQVVRDSKLPPRAGKRRAEIKAEAAKRREQLVALYKQYGCISEVARVSGFSRWTIHKHLIAAGARKVGDPPRFNPAVPRPMPPRRTVAIPAWVPDELRDRYRLVAKSRGEHAAAADARARKAELRAA